MTIRNSGSGSCLYPTCPTFIQAGPAGDITDHLRTVHHDDPPPPGHWPRTAVAPTTPLARLVAAGKARARERRAAERRQAAAARSRAARTGTPR